MQIVNYKKNPTQTSVRKATFTLKITAEDLQRRGPLLLECAYFEKDNGGSWVNWCGKEYTNHEGIKKNWNMARWEIADTTDVNQEVRGLVKKSDTPSLANASLVSEDLPF